MLHPNLPEGSFKLVYNLKANMQLRRVWYWMAAAKRLVVYLSMMSATTISSTTEVVKKRRDLHFAMAHGDHAPNIENFRRLRRR